MNMSTGVEVVVTDDDVVVDARVPLNLSLPAALHAVWD